MILIIPMTIGWGFLMQWLYRRKADPLTCVIVATAYFAVALFVGAAAGVFDA